jgi:chromosomal replication initiator protein
MKRVTERDEYLASQIIDLCARYFEINVEDMLSRSRKREYVAPRQLAAYFIKQHTDMSFSTIGKELGGLDHTSVISSIRVIN